MAQVSQYVQEMERARRATEKSGDSAEEVAARYEKQNQAMSQVGAGLMVAGAVATAATALAVKAAIDWESAWAGVTKTVDGTPAQLAAVEQGLRDLTGVLPASHEEIAAVAEAAGQLGVQAGSIVSFTRTMVDLGETTNLSANEAATALARFTNIMGTSHAQVQNLGSALVGLGNNYATTEREILEMSMRLAGAGRQVGLTEGEVLGLATALSSVGIEAEAGGSAMSKVMIDIASSVASGGDRLEQFATISGMSASQFVAQWRTEPGNALSAFVKGLANAEAQGSSTLGVLEDLGISEVRMRDALLRSSSAADMFAGAMARGNEEFAENTALADEAAKRYATVESKLGIMQNRVRDAAIDFGAVFLPAVGAVADAVILLSDTFNGLPPAIQTTVAVMVALAAGAAVAGGAFLVAIPKIAEFKIALATLATSQLPAVAAAAVGVQGAMGKATAGMSAAVRFLTGPWGLALAAAAVGAEVLMKVLDSLRASSEEMQNSLRTSADGLKILETAAPSRFTAFDAVIRDTKAQLADLDATLAELDRFQNDIWARGPWNMQKNAGLAGPADALKRIGEELAQLAGSDAPAAAQAFQKLVEQTDGSVASTRRLLDSMEPYRVALMSQASELGLNVSEMERAEQTQALLNIALADAEPEAKSAADAYRETADQAAALADEIISLIDAFNEANGVAQSAEQANARYQASLAGIADAVARQRDEYEKANGTTEGFAASLDRNTESGSANRAMLAALAGDAQKAAQAQYEQDDATMGAAAASETYTATLAAQREAFIESATAAGFNREEVVKLADQVFKLPSKKEIEVLANTVGARNSIEGLIRDMNGRRINVYVDQKYGEVLSMGGGVKAFAYGGRIPGPPSRKDNTIIHAATGEFVVNSAATAANLRLLEYINSGGKVAGFANGGQVQPQYAPPTLRLPTTSAAPALAGMGRDIRELYRLASRPIIVAIDGQQVASAVNQENSWR